MLSLRDIVCIPLQIDGHYSQFFSTKKRKKKEPENSGSFALHLRAEYLEDKACGNSGADNTGYVRAHSVHEQEVCRIGLLALNL